MSGRAFSPALRAMLRLVHGLERLRPVTAEELDHAAAIVGRGDFGPLAVEAARVRLRGLYGYGKRPNGCYL